MGEGKQPGPVDLQATGQMNAELALQQPGFGTPNQFQALNAKKGLYDAHAASADALQQTPEGEAIFVGTMDALGLNGKTVELSGSEGSRREVELSGLGINLNPGNETANPVTVDAAIADTFVFARSIPEDPNSAPRPVRQTMITLRPQQGQPGAPVNQDGHTFLPLRGVHRPQQLGNRDRYGHATAPTTEGYQRTEEASEVRITLLDGKPSTVSWDSPDFTVSRFSGDQVGEKRSGTVTVDVAKLPQYEADEAAGNGNGEAAIARNLLKGAAEMLEAQGGNTEEEKARRIQVAHDVAAVALQTRERIAAEHEAMMNAPVVPVDAADLAPPLPF